MARISQLVTVIFLTAINPLNGDLLRFPFEPSTSELQLIDEYPTCGLFQSYDQGRIFNGDEPYKHQFPWATCLLSLFYDYAYQLFQKDGKWFFVAKENVSPLARIADFNSVPKVGLNVNHDWSMFCSGTIIHQNWVLTAAHCFQQTPNGVTVLLTFGGDHCLRPVDHRKVVAWKFATDTRPATIYSREEYWKHLNLHTKYRKNTQMMADWDVSLVRIDEPLKLPEKSDVTYNPRTHPLNRICIDTSINFNYQCGDDLYAIGYGQKGTVIDQALAFMQHTIQYDKGNNNQPEYWDPRFSWNLLQGAITGPLFYLAGNFQLNSDGALRSIATCAGDSGGPSIKYLRYDSNNPSVVSARALQVGVLSTGPDCTQNLSRQVTVNGETRSEPAFSPTKYFKVSKVQEWIKSTIETETSKSSDASVYQVQDQGNLIPINFIP